MDDYYPNVSSTASDFCLRLIVLSFRLKNSKSFTVLWKTIGISGVSVARTIV